jgi:hypothetical protein
VLRSEGCFEGWFFAVFFFFWGGGGGLFRCRDGEEGEIGKGRVGSVVIY